MYSRNTLYQGPLQKYLYDDCRALICSLLKPSRYIEYNINACGADNFKRYSWPDFLEIKRDKSLPIDRRRYLTTDNCINILERNGYRVELIITIPD